jgi:hypothetical protein
LAPVALVGLVALVALASMRAAGASAQAGGGYDARPLMASLRPAERARVPRQAGVPRPEALPFYDLTVDLADDLRAFEVEETLRVENRSRRAWGSVVLRIWANAVTPPGGSPLVELVSLECAGAPCRAEQPSPDAIVVHPARRVARGDALEIRLRLRGRLRAIDPARTTMLGQGVEGLGALSGGHGGGDYGLLAHSDGVASMSVFFAQLARLRAGRWEQRDASTIGDLGSDALMNVRARVRVPDGVRVVATGLEEGPRVRGDRTEHVVRAAFVRDFALVASRRLRHLDRRLDDVTVRSWFVDGRDGPGRRALEAAVHSLRLFRRRFGDYPYTELDVVEAPLVGGAGGVEFSGMVTVATMFYRPVDASAGGGLLAALAGARGGDLEAQRRSMLELVTAHEVAHQWWHGVVGSDSRQHPFQDETLAQYAAILYFEDRYGEARARREAERQVAAGYHMMRLMGRPDGAVDRPASAFSDPLTYGGIVYGKGPFLYPALRELLGDRRFFAALRGYVADHRFRLAPPRALFDRMARGLHAARVRALERRWLEETHGDEDLGEPDLGRMLGGGATADDPTVRALLRMLGGADGSGDADALLRNLLRGLGGAGSGGAGSGGSGSGGAGSGGAGSGGSDPTLRELLRGLGGGNDAALRELLQGLPSN